MKKNWRRYTSILIMLGVLFFSFQNFTSIPYASPLITGTGLGCSDGRCIWISGSGFGNSCEVSFFDVAWSNGSTPITTVTANCSDNAATAQIPVEVLKKYVNVYVNVKNRNRGTWSEPKFFKVSESLNRYMVGIGEPLIPDAINEFQYLISIGTSVTEALSSAKQSLTFKLEKILLMKPKVVRIWIDGQDLNPALSHYSQHLNLYNFGIDSLRKAGIELIAKDQMAAGIKWKNHKIDVNFRWWQLRVPCMESTAYAPYLVETWNFWYRLAILFPQINRWEVGNETNTDLFLTPDSNICQGLQNSQFSLQQKAKITADITFYARNGIKQANPRAQVFFPGIAGVDNDYPATHIIQFLDYVYARIRENNLTNRQVYDGLAWHPYWRSSDFKDFNRAIIDFTKQRGDLGIPIWFTEFGYKYRSDIPIAEQNDVGSELRRAMNIIENDLPEVEAAIVYRGKVWNLRDANGQLFDPYGLLDQDSNLQRTPTAWAFCNFAECQKDGTTDTQSLRNLYVGIAKVPTGYFWTNGSAYCRYQSVNQAQSGTGTQFQYAPFWSRLPSYLVDGGTCN